MSKKSQKPKLSWCNLCLESHEGTETDACRANAKERERGERMEELHRRLDCTWALAEYFVELETQIAALRAEFVASKQ